MKLSIFIFLFTTSLFANYAYQGKNGGNIDMHGGKKQKLVDKSATLSNKPFFLGNMGLKDSIKKDTKKQTDLEKKSK